MRSSAPTKEQLEIRRWNEEQRQRELYEQFRENILALPIPDVGAVSESWRNKCIAMRENVQTKDLRDFLVWNCDLDMEYVPAWFDRWHDEVWREGRYLKLATASTNVKTHPFRSEAALSPVSIQHAYHLMQWEKATGKRFLDDVDMVVEVGGGYGNFARMLREDDFEGIHVIIDLPHTHEHQRLFLKLNDVSVVNYGEDDDVDGGTIVLVRESEIENYFHDLFEVAGWALRIAFVSTWGLSECPLSMRQKLFPRLHEHCTKYLISSQWTYEWQGIDNRKYFNEFAADAVRANGAKWFLQPIVGFESESYLFGRVQSEAEIGPPRFTYNDSLPSRAAESSFAPETPRHVNSMPDFFGGESGFFNILRHNITPGGSEFGLGMTLFSLAVSIRAAHVIEIGRFKGFSTFALASALKFNDIGWSETQFAKQRPDVDYVEFEGPRVRRLLSIDPHPTPEAEALLTSSGLREYVHFLNAKSEDVNFSSITMDEPIIDLLFIDGDHSYEGCLADYKKYEPLVRPGGYIVFHDYFGWYKNGENGSPIKEVVAKIVDDTPWDHALIDTGYASPFIFRKSGRRQ